MSGNRAQMAKTDDATIAATCCGAIRSTRFCPECGRELQTDPGAQLIVHLRKVVKQYEKQLLDYRAQSTCALTDQPENVSLHQGLDLRVEQTLATRDKWQAMLRWVLEKSSANVRGER